VLTRAGWQTFAAGKLHVCPQRNRIGFEEVQLNEEGRKQQGLRQDDYEAFVNDSGWAHVAWTHGVGNNQYGLRLNPLPERFTTTHWTAQKAMEFIERRDPTRPFFCYVSFDKPHPPIVPPAEFYELYRDAQFPAPAMGAWLERKTPTRFRHVRLANSWEDWSAHPLMVQQSLRGFAAMITHIDSMVGAIVGQLHEHGLFDNTWIIFTSDHGDQLFDHGNFAKGDFFRGSTNVPLIVQPPASWRKASGLRCGRADATTPAGLMDLMPTILDACGVSVPAGVEGQSLLGRMRDPSAAFRPLTFGHCTSCFGATDGRFKYMWFSDDGVEFLFDTHNDPRECDDLVQNPEHRATLGRLRGALIQWAATHGDEHVEGGKLVVRPRNWDFDAGKGLNFWNNRGRH